jgi:hypothetical protein
MRLSPYALLLALAVLAAPAAAQQAPAPTREPTGPRSIGSGDRADVSLEIPNLSVESITLTVAGVSAQLALDARVANLVQLSAGADVRIDEVNLEITGVQAEVYLYVYLDNVAAIVNRTLETLDNNPEIIEALGATLQQTVGAVGDVAGSALGPGGAVTRTLDNVTRPDGLLSQTVNTLGQTVNRTLSATGQIVESTLDTAGTVVGTRPLGSVLDLTDVVGTTTNATGQTVRRVRDEAGTLIEFTLGEGNRVSGARVVQAAGGGRR